MISRDLIEIKRRRELEPPNREKKLIGSIESGNNMKEALLSFKNSTCTTRLKKDLSALKHVHYRQIYWIELKFPSQVWKN